MKNRKKNMLLPGDMIVIKDESIRHALGRISAAIFVPGLWTFDSENGTCEFTTKSMALVSHLTFATLGRGTVGFVLGCYNRKPNFERVIIAQTAPGIIIDTANNWRKVE